MMMMMSPKRLHASVLWSSNASLNDKRLESIQLNLQLSVPNSLFLPRTSTATITFAFHSFHSQAVQERECVLQLDSIFVINILVNDQTQSMCYGHNKFLNSHLICQRFLCVHVRSHCNTVLPPVAIQWRIGSSDSKQLQFTRLHTNCSVIVKLFYLLI